MKYAGLSDAEAKSLFKQYGPNEISGKNNATPLIILLRQIKGNFVIYMLVLATIFSFIVGKQETAYTIIIVIIIVISTGFFMEYRAEQAIATLKSMIVPQTIVIRNGKEQQLAARDLVPGDIIVLRSGDKIPADAELLEEKELRVNESVLTGEAQEVHKTLTDNALFLGTFVVNGRGIAKVVHTGMNTQFGKIAGMISHSEKEMPLQKKVNNLVRYMSISALCIACVTGLVMLLRSGAITGPVVVEVLIVVIALSVAAFPEGFPVVLVTTLARGAHRMAKKNAIVNRMAIIETLGEATVICTDKTGTLTKGEMTVRSIYADGKLYDVSGIGYEPQGQILHEGKPVQSVTHPTLHQLLKTSVLCNDAKITLHEKEYKITGSPTESALVVLSAKAHIFAEDIPHERIEELPFSSHTKTMAVLCREHKKLMAYAKGAPEMLLEKCTHIEKNGKIVSLTKPERARILAITKTFTARALRTLACAYKPTKSESPETLEKELIFLGLIAMEDPPRPEVKEAIVSCLRSGIAVRMLTGDNKDTAIAVGKEIGLVGRCMEGKALDALTDEELRLVVSQYTIFARVRPEHKLRIVRALKKNGEIVTMSGDGVNDAPALKEAHIGVAMGINGTDVSRDVADLILKDDNFSTIIGAITEGRTIFKNLQKVTIYQVSINIAQVGFVFLSILLGLPLPLLAIQILFMNLLSDELTAIMLGFNPPSLDVMTAKPRKHSNLITKSLSMLLLTAGFTMLLVTLGVFVLMLHVFDEPLAVAQTTAFVTMILFANFSAFNFRSFRTPIVGLPLLANPLLFFASIASIIITIIAVYSPLNLFLDTVPLAPMHWLIAVLAASIILFVFDLLKTMNARNRFLTLE